MNQVQNNFEKKFKYGYYINIQIYKMEDFKYNLLENDIECCVCILSVNYFKRSVIHIIVSSLRNIINF
jgi:hypothetical protein